MFNSRGLLFFLLLGSISLTGFGCQGLTAVEKQAIKPVTLEYWTVFNDVDALRQLAEQYRLDHPHLTINIRQWREGEFYPRLVEALAEDKGPDIVSVRNRSLKGFVSKLAPSPLEIKDATVRVIKGKFSTETIVTPLVRPAITLEELDREFIGVVGKDVASGGKIYGLPLSADTMAIYYNKDLLDRAGVPQPPRTWDEFQAAVKKLTRFDKLSGTITQSGAALGTGKSIGAADDILYILFQQSGLKMVDKNGQAIFNQSGGRGESPVMNVVNFYTDFANSARDTYTWNEAQGNAFDAFVNGTVGFFFGYSYHYPLVKARAPQLNFRVLPLLQLNPEQSVNTASYWVEAVTVKSRHQEEAWAFIDWLTRSDAAHTYLVDTGRPAARRAFIAEQQKLPELKPFVGDLLVAENWYRGNNYDAARGALEEMLKEWLATPPDPDKIIEWRQEILNRAAAKINQTL